MKLRKINIENFRCYKDETEVEIEDLTVFVGANDSGKSSILEALDIFFNEGRAEIRFTEDDINIHARMEGKHDVKITCVFEDIPEQFLRRLEENNIPINDSSITISKTFGKNNKTFLNGEELSKKLIGEIKDYLPIYGLFKVDRTNTDDNPEIKDPLMFAVEKSLKEQEIKYKLQEVAEKIKKAIEDVANGTLDKLKKLNGNIATELNVYIPDIEELKWRDVFKRIGIYSDKGILLNKRGSGVRRLILLSFFLFEAERKRYERHTDEIEISTIYAIEEPETSLHPDQQKQFINSLIELSSNEKVQVLLTTHSPYIAKLIPVNSLRFIDQGYQYTLPKVSSYKEDNNILLNIAKRLGIHPINTKVVIFVEGNTDKKFLININENIKELKDLIHLNSEIENNTITIIPLNGSNLIDWINAHYLKGSGLLEFHLYDNDRKDYQEIIEKVNDRNDGSIGLTTSMREIENYIHWDLIEEEFNIKITDNIR
ncbi:ATP/GTP-binding protein [Sulfurihydrogenibium azorense Az-Fu1]|uniref:ATP/GTP-binding protein n=1 Tax=Sulfurihydrogenibium azorense (strain DSM 15241 / OCM 825 / Az-Fu1) TaxID=204536 RepID=C1DUM9_SULAA|nr:ATP-binding protein [Sulfurihydrogenibium azorense]ACN98893.1 ATP/GTP-binding protein [Sulfurihydrogenibium azorense Az-Fu1]